MLINEGTYDARIINAVLTEKGEEKNPVIELTVEITGNGLESPAELSKTFWFGEKLDEYNENKPEWQVSFERLRELGFVGEDISDMSAVIGFTGRCGVKNKSGKNGAYSVVTWIGRSGSKPMPANKAASFADQMRARLAAMNGGKAAPQASARPAQQRPAQPAQRPAQRPAPQAKAVEDFSAPDTSDVPF